MIVAVDPGLNGCGLAIGTDQALHWAGYAADPAGAAGRKDDRLVRIVRVATECHRMVSARVDGPRVLLVAEWPQIYREAHRSRRKADPNDLPPLAGVVSGLATLLRRSHVTRCETIYPRAWKGTLDGDAMVEQIRGVITPEEDARIDWPGKAVSHNVVDAVGILYWKQGRLNRRVIARS